MSNYFRSNKENLTNSILYFGGSIIQVFISLFTFPIYSRYLEASDFGIIGYFTSFIQFFTPLFILGLTDIFLMKYFKNSRKQNGLLLFNILFFLTILNIITYVILLFGLKYYFIYSNVSIPYSPYSIIILTSVFLETFRLFTLLLFRVQKKALNFLFLSAISPILNALFSILYVVKFDLGAAGRLGGILSAKIIVTVICFLALKKFVIVNYNFKYFRKLIIIGFPLILGAYARIPILTLDKIVLEKLDNLHELGLYTIATQITGFLFLAIMSMYQALQPEIFRFINNKDYRKLTNVTIFYVSFIILSVFLFNFISNWVINFLTAGKYGMAQQYITELSIGFGIFAIVQLPISVLLAFEKTKAVSQVWIFGGITAALSYVYFIKYFDYLGATYARILVPSLMLLFSIYLIHLKKIFYTQ